MTILQFPAKLRPVMLDHIHTVMIDDQREPSPRVRQWLAENRIRHDISYAGGECLIMIYDEDNSFAAHLMFM